MMSDQNNAAKASRTRAMLHEAKWIFAWADTEPTEVFEALFLTAWAASQVVNHAAGGFSISMHYLAHVWPAWVWCLPAAGAAGLHTTGLLVRSRPSRAVGLLFSCMFWPFLGWAQLSTGVMPTGFGYCLVLFAMSLWGLYRLMRRWRVPNTPRTWG
jgi:hypothetical protein